MPVSLLQLSLKGMSIEENAQATDPAFLGEVMELNEQLDEIMSEEDVEKFKAENQGEFGLKSLTC